MALNYDKKNGFSGIFPDIFNYFNKENSEKRNAFKQQSNDILNFFNSANGWSNEDLILAAKNTDNLDESISEMFDSLDAGGDIVSQFSNKVKESSKSMKTFQKIGNGVKNFAKSLGATFVSMGVNMLAGLAIEGIFKLISDGINKAKNEAKEIQEIIDKGKEAASEIESLENQSKENAKTVDELGKKYEKLADGVNTFNNVNLNLSDTEYQEFLDINNQLAKLFPTLTQGYDDNGNAIINLSDKAKTATDVLKEMLEQEQKVIDAKITDNLKDTVDGIGGEIKTAKGELDSAQKDIDSLNKARDFLFSKRDGTNKSAKINADNLGTDVKEYKKYLEELGFTKDEINNHGGYGQTGNHGYYVSTFTDKELEDAYNTKLKSLNSNKEAKETLYKNSSNELSKYIPYMLTGIDDKFKTTLSTIGNNIDWTNILSGLEKGEAFDKMERVLDEQLIKPFNNLSDAKKIAFQNLINLDINDEQFNGNLQEFINYIRNELSELGIDIPINLIIKDKADLITQVEKRINEITPSYKGNNTLRDFAGKNLITEEDYRLWLKATEGVKDYTVAIENYLKAKSEADKASADIIIPDNISATVDKINKQLKPAFSSLKSAYQDIFTVDDNDVESFSLEHVSIDTLNNIKSAVDAFNELEGVTKITEKQVNDFLTVLSDSSSTTNDVHRSFNELATTLVQNSNYMNADSASQKALIQTLKEMGVTTDKLEDQYTKVSHAETELKYAGYDLKDITYEQLNEFANLATTTDVARDSLISFIQAKADDIRLNTEEDVENLKMLCMSLGIASEALVKFEETKAYIERMQEHGIAGVSNEAWEKAAKDNLERFKVELGNEWKEKYDSLFDVSNAVYNGNKAGQSNKSSSTKSDTKQDFDWIERALAKVEDRITDIERVAGNAFETFSRRNSALLNDINTITSQIDLQRQAVQAYNREMAEIGLPQEYINKIKNGEMDVQTITNNSDLTEKIQSYMSLYDKVVNLQNSIEDNIIKRNTQRKAIFDNINKEYSNHIGDRDYDIKGYTGQNDRLKSYLKYDLKSIDSNYNSAESQELKKIELYKNEIALLRQQMNYFQPYTEEWYNATNTIQDLTEKQKECYDSIANYAKENFNDIASYYDTLISQITNKTDKLNSNISKITESGHIVQASAYTELAKNTMNQRKTLVDEYNRLVTELNEGVSTGKFASGSSMWIEMSSKISEVEKAISDCDIALIGFNNDLQQLKYDNFERIQNAVQDIVDEANFYLNLMDNEKRYSDKTGDTTKYGYAAIGLREQNMQTYKRLVENYDSLITDINNQLKNDPANNTLIEKRRELIEAQRSTIQNYESEKRAIVDLAKEGYDAYINSVNKTISKLKELHQLEKSDRDYQNNIEEKSKNIDSLKKQLMAFQGNDSEEARARVQQLTVSLDKAEDDLEQTQYDKYIADQEALMDRTVNDMQEYINEVLENTDQLLISMNDEVNGHLGTIEETLSEVSTNYGTTLSQSIRDIWNGADTPLSAVTTSVDNVTGTINSVVNQIMANQNAINTTIINTQTVLKSLCDQLKVKYTTAGNGNTNNNANNTPKANTSNVAKATTSAAKTTSTPKTTTTQQTTQKKTQQKSPKILSTHTIKKGDTLWGIARNFYKKEPTWKDIYGVRDANPGVIKDINNIPIGTKIKLPALPFPQYAKGTKGVNKDQLALIDELGDELVVRAGKSGDITALTKGSGVIPADLTANLMEWGKINPFENIVKVPNVTALRNNNSSTNNVTQNIVLDLKNVTNADQFIKEIQTNKRLEKVLQSVTIDTLSGKNSLNKMKY